MNDQVSFWNGAAADRWVSEQVSLDAILQPFGQAALDAAAPTTGEAVLDVGCGCGGTTLDLASRVGPTGRVLGLDVSAPMLARARERAAGRTGVSLVEGDAGAVPLDPGSFDLLYSRFGVMFFPDPLAAFTHLRAALRPGGRVAFACWRPVVDNPWAAIPFEAAVQVVGRPEPMAPDAPGPFSFADGARVARVLGGAGLRDVVLRAFEAPDTFGEGGSLADAARDISRVGPVARLLADRDEAAIAAALVAIEAALAPYASPRGGVSLPGRAWIVTARAGG